MTELDLAGAPYQRVIKVGVEVVRMANFVQKFFFFFVRPPVRLSHVSSKISCKFLSLVHILSIVQLLSTRCVSWASNMPELLLRPGLCPGPPLTARVARFLAAKYGRLLSIRDVRQGQHDAISYVCVCLFGFGCPQKLTGYYRSSRVLNLLVICLYRNVSCQLVL